MEGSSSPNGDSANDRPAGVPDRDQRCCIGLAYFSQALHERSQGPVRVSDI